MADGTQSRMVFAEKNEDMREQRRRSLFIHACASCFVFLFLCLGVLLWCCLWSFVALWSLLFVCGFWGGGWRVLRGLCVVKTVLD